MSSSHGEAAGHETTSTRTRRMKPRNLLRESIAWSEVSSKKERIRKELQDMIDAEAQNYAVLNRIRSPAVSRRRNKPLPKLPPEAEREAPGDFARRVTVTLEAVDELLNDPEMEEKEDLPVLASSTKSEPARQKSDADDKSAMSEARRALKQYGTGGSNSPESSLVRSMTSDHEQESVQEKQKKMKRTHRKSVSMDHTPRLKIPHDLKDSVTEAKTPREPSEMEILVRKAVEATLLQSKVSELIPEVLRFEHDGKKYHVKTLANPQFARIRKIFGITEKQLVTSICHSGPLKGEVSKGKSGQYFYSTPDNKFCLKTLSDTEFSFLSGQFVLEYASYMAKHKNSLLPRFYACIKIQKHRFIIMNNVFCSSLELSEVYDIKGSKKGREARKSTESVLKDNDLLRKQRQFWFGPEMLLGLYLQLSEDVTFLMEHQVMDYSLLIGVHIIDENSPLYSDNAAIEDDVYYRSMFQKEYGGMLAQTKDGELLEEVYFLGVIDILTQFNWNKRMESLLFGSLTASHDQISAVDPDLYARRFLNFIIKNVIHADLSKTASQ